MVIMDIDIVNIVDMLNLYYKLRLLNGIILIFYYMKMLWIKYGFLMGLTVAADAVNAPCNAFKYLNG